MTPREKYERAKEVMQPWEIYKIFPLAWLDKDERGQWSAMRTAEAKGFLEGWEARSEMVGELEKTVAFFACVIKSGEPWTEACQKAKDAAFQAKEKP